MHKNTLSIGETAKLTGLTVRTLHHYDDIGLVSPKTNPNNNYREYTQDDIAKIQQILFFKEVGFELREIVIILSSPNFNKRLAFTKQKDLLLAKKQRLEQIINLIDNVMEEENMSFKEFDNTEINKLQTEAKEMWGNTDAYKEFEQKNKGKTDWSKEQKEMEQLLINISELMDCDVKSKEVQNAVKAFKDHITNNYYTCTKEILASLGEMYIADKRFKDNIDSIKFGLTEFLVLAIKEYTKN